MLTVEGIEPEEYVYALGELINSKDIVNYSKISNGRIRIYLKNETLVEQITNKYKTIKVNNSDIDIRPLLIKSTRIIISNACPEIPHALIEDALVKLGLKPNSAMIFLRAGLKKPGFEHILSSRRCVYIASDYDTLPNTTTINYENTEHRIFIADDSAYCIHCKKHGHVIDECKTKRTIDETVKNTKNNTSNQQQQIHDPQLQQNQHKPIQEEPQEQQSQTESPIQEKQQIESQQQTSQSRQEGQLLSTSEIQQIEYNNPEHCTPTEPDIPTNNLTESQHEIKETSIPVDQVQLDTKHQSQKRTLSNAESTDSIEQIQTEEDKLSKDTPFTQPDTLKNNSKKRPKNTRSGSAIRTRSTSPGTPTQEWLEPLKATFQKNPHVINIYQFQNFVELARNHNDPLALAKNYVEDPEALIMLMNNLKKATSNKSGKNRLTRLINRIEQQLAELDTE